MRSRNAYIRAPRFVYLARKSLQRLPSLQKIQSLWTFFNLLKASCLRNSDQFERCQIRRRSSWKIGKLMHSYLGMVWFAVHFCHKACGISRTNCQGQSWNKLCNVCETHCLNKVLMFVGTIYLLAVTLCSSFVHFGR